MSNRKFLAAGLLLLLEIGIVQSARAQVVIPESEWPLERLRDCYPSHFYGPHSPDAPDIVAKSLRGPGSVFAFRTCSDAVKNGHYFVRKVRDIGNGICRVMELEVFPGTAQDTVHIFETHTEQTVTSMFDLLGWKDHPPEAWAKAHYVAQTEIMAQEGSGKCPPAEDQGYVPVGPISDGLLKTFYKLWHNISSSPEVFDKTFARTTTIGPARDHDGLIRDLRHLLFEPSGKPLKLSELSCKSDYFDGCDATVGGRFVLHFDVSDKGLTITAIDSISVP